MFDFYKSKQLQKFEEAVDSLFVELMQNRVEAERACRMLEKTWRQAYIELTSLSNCKSLNSLHAQMMKELSGRLDAKEDDILPDKIQNILDFVKDKYQQQINLAYVSNHFNMGYSYTSTLFKKHTGMSFTQYLTKFRMDKALELLENTNCYVYEIANKVGFSDNTYFYKLFKEKYGVTPREYYQNMCHGNSNV
jgi:YesN/AraC family two-component response regulator